MVNNRHNHENKLAHVNKEQSKHNYYK